MPHYHKPKLKHAHVLILTRLSKLYGGGGYHNHTGLGVNAQQTIAVLREHGVKIDGATVEKVEEIAPLLRKHPTLTHVIVEVPWIPLAPLRTLLAAFPQIHFVTRTHSQIGFLQVEPITIQNIRDDLLLQEQVSNFSFAANSERLAEFVRLAYQSPALYLPNLYDTKRTTRKRDEDHDHRNLRIGLFGAMRLLKNLTTSAAGAMILAQERSSQLEILISTERGEVGEKNSSVYKSLKAMTADLPWCTLREEKWRSWPEFRRLVATCDLVMQVSPSETHCIVAADAVTEGVPVVVSSAIEWAPKSWRAEVDDASDISRVGSMLLSSKTEARRGLEHLQEFMVHAVERWLRYLSGNPAATIENPAA